MHLRILASIVMGVLILGCTGTTSPPAAAPQSASPAGFRNLQVLARDISRDELLAVMRNFTRSLGVRCNHCHVVTATTPKEELDFPSDAKEEKRVARVMVRMTQQINAEWLERVEEAEGHEEAEPTSTAAAAPSQPRVGCWTCHRGHEEPEMPPPPPPRQDQQ